METVFDDLFEGNPSTTLVVDKGPPPTEGIPFKIPMGIVEHAMSNRYAGDGTVNPADHLLYINELCGLFKIAGVPTEVVKRKFIIIGRKSTGVV